MRYNKEYKDSIIKRMLPPNNESVQHLAHTEGLNEQTLRNWRKAAVRKGRRLWVTGILLRNGAVRTNFSLQWEQ